MPFQQKNEGGKMDYFMDILYKFMSRSEAKVIPSWDLTFFLS